MSSLRVRSVALLRASLVVLGLSLLNGCSQVSYYGQSVVGHSRLMLARQPIAKAIEQANRNGNAELATQLLLVKQLREFSIQQLGLPDNGSYNRYVDLQREFPVWNVVAAEEFSVEAKSWCYLIIGCAAYRGYFSQDDALSYAESLRQQGLETTVGGVAAYSTLGWFDDPVLPSMLRYGVADLAETLFHELAHQQLYIKNNSDFNEAFATVVGEQGAALWLQRHRPELLDDYRLSLQARSDFSNLLKNLKQKLAALYALELSDTEKRLAKRQRMLDFKADYQSLKAARWQGVDWYGRWFEQATNNARLAALSTYREQAPRFLALLKDCGNDFARFYASVANNQGMGAEALIPPTCVVE